MLLQFFGYFSWFVNVWKISGDKFLEIGQLLQRPEPIFGDVLAIYDLEELQRFLSVIQLFEGLVCDVRAISQRDPLEFQAALDVNESIGVDAGVLRQDFLHKKLLVLWGHDVVITVKNRRVNKLGTSSVPEKP
jgi:hypothetical protein